VPFAPKRDTNAFSSLFSVMPMREKDRKMSISRPIHFVRKDDKTWGLGQLTRQAKGTEKRGV